MGATVAEADRLEAQVKLNLKEAGAKLAKGIPAPSLAEIRALPSKPLNCLIDAEPAEGDATGPHPRSQRAITIEVDREITNPMQSPPPQSAMSRSLPREQLVSRVI